MIKKIYNTDDIVTIGSDTASAVSETVDLVKKYVDMQKWQGVDRAEIKSKLNEVFNESGSDMSGRVFFAFITESTDTVFDIELERGEYIQLVEGNQYKLKAVNKYIAEKAFSPLGVSESRKIREILSEEWAHKYISLIAHKFNREINKVA